MINTGNTDNTGIVRFNQHITPVPIEREYSSNNTRYVPYGLTNLYPNFLVELYNNSALHKGIINAKKDYIIGDGIRVKGCDNPVDFEVNAKDSFDEFISKIVGDMLIYNYYAVEVVYNKLGQAIQWNHIPGHKIRSNRDKSKFWFGYDWLLEPNNTTSYEAWKPGINADGYSKVFFYTSYAPSVNNVYPIPEYSGAIKSIETDIEIRKFHLNNITNQFSVSSIITFFGGETAPDIKAALTKKIQDSYSGTGGGKFIIGYENKDGQAPNVQNIAPSEWDKAFEQVKKDVEQDILTAHSAVSPMLFGIKTEGQLGGATELETSYELFRNIYVRGRRSELEAGLNKLFADSGIGELEFKDKGSLFSATLSDAMKMKIYTINDLREEAGLAPLLNGDRLIDEVKPVPTQEPTVNGTIPANDTAGSIVTAAPANTSTSGASQFSSINYHLTDEDFEKVKHIGTPKEKFRTFKKLNYSVEKFADIKNIEIEFDEEKDISEYLISNTIKNLSLVQIKAAIRKDLGISVTTDQIKNIIQGLEDSGVINKTDVDKGITIRPTEKTQPTVENIRRVQVVYSYEGPQDDKNRPFCAKLMANDRFYTREDIQQMASLFGYDIFSYRGGFYHNPATNSTTPYCRHNWQAQSVVKINPEAN